MSLDLKTSGVGNVCSIETKDIHAEGKRLEVCKKNCALLWILPNFLYFPMFAWSLEKIKEIRTLSKKLNGPIAGHYTSFTRKW